MTAIVTELAKLAAEIPMAESYMNSASTRTMTMSRKLPARIRIRHAAPNIWTSKDSVADPVNRENCKSTRLSTPSDKMLEPSMYMEYIDLESPMEPHGARKLDGQGLTYN